MYNPHLERRSLDELYVLLKAEEASYKRFANIGNPDPKYNEDGLKLLNHFEEVISLIKMEIRLREKKQ